jgi:hypothetical protein
VAVFRLIHRLSVPAGLLILAAVGGLIAAAPVDVVQLHMVRLDFLGLDIVRRAAGIPEDARGLEGFIRAADALVTPATVAMAAITPLAMLVGLGTLMFGSRRGMPIIGAALGVLVVLGGLKGIVA